MIDPNLIVECFNYHASVKRFHFAKCDIGRLEAYVEHWIGLCLNIHPYDSVCVTVSATRLKKLQRVAGKHHFKRLSDFLHDARKHHCVVCKNNIHNTTARPSLFCNTHAIREPNQVPSVTLCSVDNCPIVVLPQDQGWCFQHRDVCDAQACTTRIEKDQHWCQNHHPRCHQCDTKLLPIQLTWCRDHDQECTHKGCMVRVSTYLADKRCETHHRLCKVGTCSAPTIGVIGYIGDHRRWSDTHCDEHMPRCKAELCSIHCPGEWCDAHAFECKHWGCQIRCPSTNDRRCPQHQARCRVCNVPVRWMSRPWCPEHVNICRVKQCTTRVSWQNTFCDKHLPLCAGCHIQLTSYMGWKSDNLPLCSKCL